MLETKGTMFRLVFSIIIVSLHYYVVNCEVTFYPCSNKTSQKGESIQIVKANLDEKNKEVKFEFNSTGLESILLRQEIRNKELIVLSITGDYRKGKSFILSLLLQYLEGGGKGLENSKINLNHGFHWRGGSERDTGGMLMWSEPFCVKTESGKELAILLMDTQGANDGELSAGETATVFGLSFLTSSVILYNQQKQIQDNDLKILKVFTEYGKIITGDHETNHKPFQKLLFLIRDWPNPKEYNYGDKGGNDYIEKMMKNTEKLQEESKKFRNRLRFSFTNISGFLVPHPGLKVAEGDFRPEDIEKIFIDNVNELAAVLFQPKNSVIKQVAGKNINAEQMFEYFKTNMNTFKKNKIKMTDFIEAKCESDNLIAFGNAKVFYTTQMSTNCSDESDSIEPNKLRNNHVIIRKQTIEQFNQSTNSLANICGDTLNKYLTDLVKWLEEQFGVCSSKNQIKRLEYVMEQLQVSNKERKGLKDSFENVTKQLVIQQNLIEDQNRTINSQKLIIDNSKKEIDRLRNTTDGFNEKMTEIRINEGSINNSIDSLRVTTNNKIDFLNVTINSNMKSLSEKINDTMTDLSSTIKKNMTDLKGTTYNKIDLLNVTINSNMKSLSEKINNTMTDLSSTIKKNMTDLKGTTNEKLDKLSNKLNNNIRAATSQDFLVPIGFIYTQLPFQDEPNMIWTGMTWEDISHKYPGYFFRVTGGNASSFGEIQNYNAPRLTDVSYDYKSGSCGVQSSFVVYEGVWSQWTGGCNINDIKFFVSAGEVRPLNMATRIWKRIR